MIQKIDYIGIEDIIILIIKHQSDISILITENHDILKMSYLNMNEKRYLLGFTSSQNILKKIMNLKYLVRISGC
jgi:hypothetical protein